MHTITTREIVTHNYGALREGTLAASHLHGDCLYAAGPYRCAIGACLTPEEIDRVECLGINGDTIAMLKKHDVVAFEDYSIAFVTQQIHDRWLFSGNSIDSLKFDESNKIPQALQDFLDEHHADRVDERFFRRWLAAVQNHLDQRLDEWVMKWPSQGRLFNATFGMSTDQYYEVINP